MNVGRYDYSSQFGSGIDDLMEELRRMLLTGRYELGSTVQSFENDFAGFMNAKFAVGVNSGTDALILGLMALGVRPGDEVITQANTFYATVAAICLVGAKPILVDADEGSFLISQQALTDAVGPRTRVILPVHLYGKPTPMEPILSLAQRHGCMVVEDAAQSHGAKWRGRCTGTFGDIGTFSFHPSKNLAAAGDGGALVTSSDKVETNMRMLHRLGQRKQNDHAVIGYNSKLDAIQAVILRAKLAHLDKWNDDRRRIARMYRNGLAGLPIDYQAWDETNEEHVFHLFQIRVACRDALLEHLVAQGVDAVVRYPTPIHLQPAFAHLGYRQGQFPVSERLSRELLCLPMRPNLSDEEVAYVVGAIRDYFGALRQ